MSVITAPPRAADEAASRHGLRSLATGSLLLSRPGNLEQRVEQPNPDRRIRVIGCYHRLRTLAGRVQTRLRPALENSAEQRVQTPDGRILLAIRLPVEP